MTKTASLSFAAMIRGDGLIPPNNYRSSDADLVDTSSEDDGNDEGEGEGEGEGSEAGSGGNDEEEGLQKPSILMTASAPHRRRQFGLNWDNPAFHSLCNPLCPGGRNDRVTVKPFCKAEETWPVSAGVRRGMGQ